MTARAPTGPGRAPPPAGAPRGSGAAAAAAAWLCLVPVVLLFRPYRGAVQDALIYLGRALADRDPSGVGADLLFAHDGQTGFSVARPALRHLLGALSPAQASMALVAAGLLLWLAAAVALARRLAGDGGVVPLLVCLFALPSWYGGSRAFGYAEAIATPRLFCEAAVLGGLSAILAGRARPGWALLGLGALIHPLMALPGLAVAGLALALEDARWWAAIAAAASAAVAAALLGLPVADRLLVPVDAEWLSILRQRCPNLFPSLWGGDVYGLAACQAASALLAAARATGRARPLLRAAVGAAACGVGLSCAVGALWPSVLVLQLQPWRALWILAVLGNLGFPLAAPGLWAGGRAGRLALASLALAWLSAASLPAAAAFGALALGVDWAARRGTPPDVSPRLLRAAWGAVALLLLVSLAAGVAGLAAAAGALPAAPPAAAWPYVLASGVPAIPVVVGGLAFGVRRSRPARGAAPAAAAVLALAALLLWDARDGERIVLDRGTDAALQAAVGPGGGEVLWLGDHGEAWWLAGHPSFFNGTQGSPMVFSRDLAIAWRDRAAALRGLGLIGPRDVAPWSPADDGPAPALTPRAVDGFCGDARRPAAIVAPGLPLDRLPPGRRGTVWRPAMPFDDLAVEGSGLRHRAVEAFTVVRCRDPGPATGPEDGRTPAGLN